ncbi:hypothetical protein GEMRC1_013399 [Eukaryota sp. GEM-RC1]
MLENLLIVSARQSASFYYSYQLNNLNLVLEHSKSYNYSSPSILFSFVIDQILFSHQVFIPICSIEFVSLEPPTRGGFVPVFAFNLGLDPIVIHHSSAMINQSLVYSSKNDEFLNVFVFEGHGCHEMIISRSTDSEKVYCQYCFKRPFIQSVTPNPFPLTGSLILKGTDFSTSFELLSIVSQFPQISISEYTHEEILLNVTYVCNTSSTPFEIFLVIGNQSSNSYQLNFGPPIVSYHPVPLSPFGENIYIYGPNFGKMFTVFIIHLLDFLLMVLLFKFRITMNWLLQQANYMV